MNPKTFQLFQDCINQWGSTSQILMCIEECNELAVCLAHSLRANKPFDLDAIKLEITDVLITIQQMQVLFKIGDMDLIKLKNQRLKRLEDILKTDIEMRGFHYEC